MIIIQSEIIYIILAYYTKYIYEDGKYLYNFLATSTTCILYPKTRIKIQYSTDYFADMIKYFLINRVRTYLRVIWITASVKQGKRGQ